MVKKDLHSLWEQRLAEHAASDKSISAWCMEHSISKRQFYYWRNKLRISQAEKNEPVKWLPLEIERMALGIDSINVC